MFARARRGTSFIDAQATYQDRCPRKPAPGSILRVADHPPQNSAPNQNRNGTLSGVGLPPQDPKQRDEAPHSRYAWLTLHEQQRWQPMIM
jgi:hypothetical protein